MNPTYILLVKHGYYSNMKTLAEDEAATTVEKLTRLYGKADKDQKGEVWTWAGAGFEAQFMIVQGRFSMTYAPSAIVDELIEELVK